MYEIITGIVGLIAIITFFVMAVALSNISHAVRNINRILTFWSKDWGVGLKNVCKKCKKNFEGKVSACPHCGDPKEWD